MALATITVTFTIAMGRKPKNPLKVKKLKAKIERIEEAANTDTEVEKAEIKTEKLKDRISHLESGSSNKKKPENEVDIPDPAEEGDNQPVKKKRRSKAQKASVEKMLKARRRAWRDEKRDKKGKWMDDGIPNKRPSTKARKNGSSVGMGKKFQ